MCCWANALLNEVFSKTRIVIDTGGELGECPAIGDGYKYRGRGIWQLTGKSNYIEFNKFYQGKFGTTIDLVQNPELVATNIEIAVISALWYYKNRVNIIIDQNTTVRAVTKEVNGGDTGLDDSEKQYLNVKNNIKNCK